MQKLKVFVVTLAATGLIAWGYSQENHFLLLLTLAWFGAIASLHGVGLVWILLSKKARSEKASSLDSGMLSGIEMKALVAGITTFSFVAYFTIESHWFLLAHGGWWAFIGVRPYLPEKVRGSYGAAS